MSFNPRIDLAQRDFARAQAIAAGGLPVARQWYNYNTARKIVSAIKRQGVPDFYAKIRVHGDGYRVLFLYRLDFSFFDTPAGFGFLCSTDYNLETAVLDQQCIARGLVEHS